MRSHWKRFRDVGVSAPVTGKCYPLLLNHKISRVEQGHDPPGGTANKEHFHPLTGSGGYASFRHSDGRRAGT